jgi:hypothetical protein
MFLVKSSDRYLCDQYITLEAEKLDAPFDDEGQSLLAVLCKNFDAREKQALDWLISKKCDPLKADKVYTRSYLTNFSQVVITQ